MRFCKFAVLYLIIDGAFIYSSLYLKSKEEQQQIQIIFAYICNS